MPSTAGYSVGFTNATEQREPVQLRVRGTIPSWLTGSLYRTGPGRWQIASPAAPSGVVNIEHWFDGLAMHHHFDIRADGTVWYNNRLGAEGRGATIAQAGQVTGVSFAQRDPCEKIFDKFFAEFKPAPPPRYGPSDRSVGVTITRDLPGVSGHSAVPKGTQHVVVSKTDTALQILAADTALQILAADTLEPPAVTSYGELDARLEGQLSAAHSCVDAATGEQFNYVLKFGAQPTYSVFKIRDCGAREAAEPGVLDIKADVLAQITDAPPAYLHSLALTDKYVVLCIWQADFAQ